MKVVRLSTLNLVVSNEGIFSLIKDGAIISLVKFKLNLEEIDKLAAFKGSRAFLLKVCGEQFLVGVDDSLVLVNEKGVQKVVLKASRAENFFWHAAEIGEYTFVQEYGHPPTYIYASKDLEDWRKIVANVDLDKHSKHFHYIVWDPYREWLIATLGDGCLTHVVYSEDLGQSWKPLYRGPWQFVPIEPLKDMIVFGMDSGIVRGGVATYYFPDSRWKFVFLKWLSSGVRVAQMCDLKQLDNGIYVAALGTPQAVVASKDLTTWHPLYVEGFKEDFNYHMMLSEGRNFLACSTGKSLLVFEKDELKSRVLSSNPVVSSYRAYMDRLKGLGFTLKSMLIAR
ncbi:MAG: hypothetical protein QW359_00110 [Metallosphaera sp.]